jgi:magnesium-transporting ATPase (P-type)
MKKENRMFKKSMLFMGSLLLMASSVFAANPFEVSIWERYAEGLGWAIVASIGFSVGVAIALKVFDWFSSDIEEWEEIKKGNWSVAIIFVAMIIMIGILVHKVI